jgi:hypothetical protein
LRSATIGSYVVYLFDALGDRAYLTLAHGSTVWDGDEYVARPPSGLATKMAWAHSVIAARLIERPGLIEPIDFKRGGAELGPATRLGP